MNQRPRIRPTTVRKLCSIVLCGLVSVIALHDAEAGEAHARRLNGFRNGQVEARNAQQFGARNARQAERIQQRSQQREAAMQRPSEPQQPIAPPAFQPADVPVQNRPGRMTLDERRALRQQINEAGRDVYRPTRP